MDILFFFSALVVLAGALILVTQKNPVYALLGLLIAFGATSGVFLALDAPFVAVSQIIIYAGALAVLFLFVLMFTDTRTSDDVGLPSAVGSRAVFNPCASGGLPEKKRKKRRHEGFEMPPALGAALDTIQLPRPMAAVISLAFLVCVTLAIVKLPEQYSQFEPIPASIDTGLRNNADPNTVTTRVVEYGTTDAISYTIFEGFPLAFEVVSLLIFAAVLGAVLLARRHLAGIPGTRDVGREGPHA
jgi:NADH:ubiquinone oxidoreductase subunit 6 (subunit J)